MGGRSSQIQTEAWGEAQIASCGGPVAQLAQLYRLENLVHCSEGLANVEKTFNTFYCHLVKSKI